MLLFTAVIRFVFLFRFTRERWKIFHDRVLAMVLRVSLTWSHVSILDSCKKQRAIEPNTVDRAIVLAKRFKTDEEVRFLFIVFNPSNQIQVWILISLSCSPTERFSLGASQTIKPLILMRSLFCCGFFFGFDNQKNKQNESARGPYVESMSHKRKEKTRSFFVNYSVISSSLIKYSLPWSVKP
jgi:hypothetical protein